MEQLLIRFLQEPGAETFLALRESVRQSDAYRPFDGALRSLFERFAAGEREALAEGLAACMKNYLLNPGAHLLSALLARERGDKELELFELAIFRRLLDGLLSTGDGSREKPWRALHIDDEYDLLSSLGETCREQALCQEEETGRWLNRLTCESGRELWFDITDPYTRLNDMLGAGESAPD